MLIYYKGSIYGINKLRKYLKWSKKIIHKCNHKKYKITAVIVINGKPISYGWNNIDKTHPVMGLRRKHAEITAINRCKHKINLNKAILIVYGEDKFGNTIKSKPCKYCQKFIKKFNLKKIVYSTPNGYQEL